MRGCGVMVETMVVDVEGFGYERDRRSLPVRGDSDLNVPAPMYRCAGVLVGGFPPWGIGVRGFWLGLFSRGE